MINIEYANAYSEVLEILKYIPPEDYSKIPEEKINLFIKNHNKDYVFSYDINKTLDEQNVSKKAKTIIAILFRDYWATDKQRQKIRAKELYDKQLKEQKNSENYSSNVEFKTPTYINDNSNFDSNSNSNSNLPVEVKKETLLNRFFKFIKNLFNKN